MHPSSPKLERFARSTIDGDKIEKRLFEEFRKGKPNKLTNIYMFFFVILSYHVFAFFEGHNFSINIHIMKEKQMQRDLHIIYYLGKEVRIMQQPLQPLFQKGDKVIYLYHNEEGKTKTEVCTIESIILGDHIIYYELFELSEVVMESELIPFQEVDEWNGEEEEDAITFIQNFNLDDEVFVEGYEEEKYIVKGIIIEIYRYKHEEWTEVSYELEKDGMCIYAYDEDMRLIEDPSEVQQKKSPTHQSDKNDKNVNLGDVDVLLDDYNDYMSLYHMFGDEEYKELAEAVLDALKNRPI